MLTNSLTVLQTQQQALAPQQQFALKVLQMPAAELLAEAELAAQENPFLERDELSTPLPVNVTTGIEREDASQPGESADRFGETPPGVTEQSPLERIYTEWPAASGSYRDDISPVEQVAQPESLRKRLLAELASLALAHTEHLLVECLIEELDERGFLSTPLAEVAQSYRQVADVPLEAWSTALKTLQTFDPPGVGAASAVEALVIETQRACDDGLVSKAGADLLCEILKNDLSALAKRDMKRLRSVFKRIGMPEDEAILEEALEFVTHLNPHPAADFSVEAPQYVVADLLVVRAEASEKGASPWLVHLNPNAVPQLRLSSSSHLASFDEHSPLARYLREARNLVAALEARHATLLAAARFAVDRQAQFFDAGASALVPLTIQETAAALGLSESTVSRAVSGKFLQTPKGTIELRTLFTRAALKGGEARGESISQQKIRSRIAEIIRTESPEAPLSDQALTDRLVKEGCDITRRTVAKYRDLEGIPPARLRARRLSQS